MMPPPHVAHFRWSYIAGCM